MNFENRISDLQIETMDVTCMRAFENGPQNVYVEMNAREAGYELPGYVNFHQRDWMKPTTGPELYDKSETVYATAHDCHTETSSFPGPECFYSMGNSGCSQLFGSFIDTPVSVHSRLQGRDTCNQISNGRYVNKEDVPNDSCTDINVWTANGEVFVELYGHRYPIDVTSQIELTPSHTAEEKTILPCPPYVESPVNMGNTDIATTPKGNRFGRRGVRKGCRLWEFIRDLLINPQYNPTHVTWLDRANGEFRLVSPKEIARMWGVKKGNPHMTYEKLSRAMRYYYKRNILSPVFGRRLVYRFGTKSSGW